MGVVIGLFSAKGGVGKTLLATNLAVAFGSGCRRKTILLDLNQGNGTADHLLDLSPERSWADLVSVLPELTPDQIELVVTKYCSELDFLASPMTIGVDDELEKEDIAFLINALKDVYELVVLDTPSILNSTVVGSLDLADIKVFMLTPDAPCLRCASRFINSNQEVTGLVINQFSQGAAITPTEIKDHLGYQILGVFPIDQYGVWANVSYGDPCVLKKGSKLGKSIQLLATRLLRWIDQGGANNCKTD